MPGGFELSKHQTYVAEELSRPHEDGEVRVINMPPRSGKTTLAGDLIRSIRASGLATLYMPESGPVAEMYAPADRNVGFGGALTGNAFDLIVLDDPLGTLAWATEGCRRELTGAAAAYFPYLRTKLKPDGLLVVLETRQDEDDATGWFKRHTENLTHVVIPTITSGESFFPELWPTEQLRRIEREVGPKIWGTMYLQQPSEVAA